MRSNLLLVVVLQNPHQEPPNDHGVGTCLEVLVVVRRGVLLMVVVDSNFLPFSNHFLHCLVLPTAEGFAAALSLVVSVTLNREGRSLPNHYYYVLCLYLYQRYDHPFHPLDPSVVSEHLVDY